MFKWRMSGDEAGGDLHDPILQSYELRRDVKRPQVQEKLSRNKPSSLSMCASSPPGCTGDEYPESKAREVG